MHQEEKKYGVFISYSHEDAKFVSPIVTLISSMRKDLVFQDTKDLRPGKKWEPQLSKALNEAEIIILFWCKHAAMSDYVKKEYEQAIKDNKDILPVLLDDCKLREDLAAYQWIDFQNIISHGGTNSPAKFRPVKLLWLIPLAVIVVILTFPFLINLNSGSFPEDTASYAENNSVDTGVVIMLILFALLLVFLITRFFKRNKSGHRHLNAEIIASEIKSKLNERLPPR